MAPFPPALMSAERRHSESSWLSDPWEDTKTLRRKRKGRIGKKECKKEMGEGGTPALVHNDTNSCADCINNGDASLRRQIFNSY